MKKEKIIMKTNNLVKETMRGEFCGLRFESDKDLCRKLGVKKCWLQEDGTSLEECTRRVIKRACLRFDIDGCSVEGIAKHFGRTKDFINQWLDEDEKRTIKKYIWHEKYGTVRIGRTVRKGKGCGDKYEYRNIKWCNNARLCEKLDVDYDLYSDWTGTGRKDVLDFIDYVLDERPVEVCYGIEYSSKRNLCRKLGIHYWTLENAQKKYNLSIEEFVKRYLYIIANEADIPYMSIDGLAEYFKTTAEDINEWLDSNKASIKDYINFEKSKVLAG